MQYLGGKARAGLWVAKALLADTPRRSTYLEPFVGAGWVLWRVAPGFRRVEAGDYHQDLCLLWDAILNGWEPPQEVTRAEYTQLRDAEPSALRAFAGFGLSFGGKWFGGYASNDRGDDYCRAARRGLLRKATGMVGVKVEHRDYRSWSPGSDHLVYCDPPYQGTTQYRGGNVDGFDHDEFWDVMTRWSTSGAQVYVSEYTAPTNLAEVVWEQPVKGSLERRSNNRTVIERLYRVTSH